jgi:CheY-like chemotaxis protein
MKQRKKPITILLAEDDSDDRHFIQEAFKENRLANRLETVENGEDLMDFLYKRGKFAKVTESPRLLLLDLNMPKKSGLEALQEIKADENLRSLPIVVLTSSKKDEDIIRSYGLGATSFIQKPVTFDSLVELVKHLENYWFQLVELPTMED